MRIVIAILAAMLFLAGCDQPRPVRTVRILELPPADPQSGLRVLSQCHTLVEYTDTKQRAMLSGHWGAVGDEFEWRKPDWNNGYLYEMP